MRMAEVTVGTEVPTGRADRTPGLCGEGRGRAPAGLQCSPQGQARDRNSFSIRSRFTVWSSPSSAAVMHCCSPLAIILKPARSSARDTAASWVTTSAQSRPDSSIAMTPRIWPSARRNRLITSPVAFWSTRIAVSSSWRAGPTLPPGVLPGRLSTHDRLMTHGSPAPTGILGGTDQATRENPVLRSAEPRLSDRLLPLVTPARLYVCGITPYDVTHLGHAATFIWSDVATSVLRMAGVEVAACRNVTDVDDVLTRAAGSRGRAYDELALHRSTCSTRTWPRCRSTRLPANRGRATTSPRSSSSPPRCLPTGTPTSGRGMPRPLPGQRRCPSGLWAQAINGA